MMIGMSIFLDLSVRGFFSLCVVDRGDDVGFCLGDTTVVIGAESRWRISCSLTEGGRRWRIHSAESCLTPESSIRCPSDGTSELILVMRERLFGNWLAEGRNILFPLCRYLLSPIIGGIVHRGL